MKETALRRSALYEIIQEILQTKRKLHKIILKSQEEIKSIINTK